MDRPHRYIKVFITHGSCFFGSSNNPTDLRVYDRQLRLAERLLRHGYHNIDVDIMLVVFHFHIPDQHPRITEDEKQKL
jgi:hypothetical protein